mgnify:CR=1 FL=1
MKAVGPLFNADIVAGGDVRTAELFGAAEQRAGLLDDFVGGVRAAVDFFLGQSRAYSKGSAVKATTSGILAASSATCGWWR